MNIFRRGIKKTIKALGGYDIRTIGRGSFASVKSDVEMRAFYPGVLLLTETKHEEVTQSVELYHHLGRLRLGALLKKYDINLVLDVGANRGQFAAGLRQMGYKQRIISFEPLSSAFEELKTAAKNDPHWQICNIALGAENTKQKIHCSQESSFSSFLESTDGCEKLFGKPSVGSKEETVTVRRLDEVLHETVENPGSARIFLKMDTQGYDLKVFSGLGRMCNQVVALQSEVSAVPIYHNMPHLTESISFYEKAGFEIAGLYPVTTENSTLRVIEFDCLMLNSSMLRKSGDVT
jgi:FkbM family methyltransferase